MTAEHGTVYRYRQGCRCQACVKANYAAQQRWREGKRGADPQIHGTANSYSVYGCRCKLCRRAHAATRRGQRHAKKMMRERIQGR